MKRAIRKAIIYSLTIKKGGKYYIYVGHSAKGENHRRKQHLFSLEKGKHRNKKMQALWNSIRRPVLEFKIIEKCLIKDRLEREQFWIDKLKPNLNLAPVAGSTLGYKFPQEVLDRLSKSHKGARVSSETKRKMSIAHRGKKCPYVSKALKGKKRPAYISEISRATHLGKPKSPEHCLKISLIRKAWWKSLPPKRRKEVTEKMVEGTRRVLLGKKRPAWIIKKFHEARDKARKIKEAKRRIAIYGR